MSEKARPSGGRLLLGFVVLTLGILFTLDNLGIMDAQDTLLLWPLILVAIGLFKLFSPGHGSGRGFGVLLVLGGVWLVLWNLGWIATDPTDLWPVLLILLGGVIIWHALFRSRSGADTTDAASFVNASAVLGGVERRSSSKDFRGGDLTAVLGGCEIDLRGASVQGDSAVIDTFALMGGIEIRVPADWAVSGRVTALLGSYEDKTEPPKEGPAKTLVLKGLSILGGVEVKN